MPMISQDFAAAFARHWIEAWNRHDLDAVLAHYTEDFRLFSPMIAAITGEPYGMLQGKAAVRAYWSQGLESIPDLYFELHDILTGVDSLTLYYQGHRGMVAETFLFDETGKAREAHACYSATSPSTRKEAS